MRSKDHNSGRVGRLRRIAPALSLWAAWAGLMVPGAARAYSGSKLPRLASFDISLLGLSATVDPLEPTVPKNTDSGVRIVVRAGDQPLSLTDVTTFLGPGFEVRAELSGPGLDHAITLPQLDALSDPAADPLLLPIPALPISGDYLLSNIRILQAGKPVLDVTPSQIPVKVIEQVLVTSVKTRPLTLDEIREKGIVLDSNDYLAFEFTLGLEQSSQSVQFSLPVVFDRQGVPVPQVISPPPEPSRTGVTASNDQPDPLIVPALLQAERPPEIDAPEFEKAIRLPSGAPIQIPSVLVIPGNVGYLKQFFSAQLFVANGAPVGSGLTIRNVTGTVQLPPGPDLVLGTADDPLALPDTVRGPQPSTMHVMGIGPDGTPATSDDVDVLKPSEQGQAEFLIRGEHEGFHSLSFDISATLDGLAIGPVTVKGSAQGGVLVRNPFFDMTFTIPSVVRKGETFPVFVTVTNIGQGIANDVQVTLDASRVAGATLVGDATQHIDTLRTHDAHTLEFKFVSQRTGQVVATYLNLDTSTAGSGNLKFSLGVGERGVALSPDTLVLPTSVSSLPASVVDAAMRVLGQAWSIANAAANTLPAGVTRISRSVATQKALALAEAGLRGSLGQDARDGVRDLAFDFYGGAPLDAGFDQLLRQTDAGHELARALGNALSAATQGTGGVLGFARSVDQVAISGPDYVSIAVGRGAGAAPVDVALIDSTGLQSVAQAATGELPRSEIPGAVWLPLDASASGPLLGVLTALSAPVYTLDLTGKSSGAVDLAVTQPRGDGNFVRAELRGLAVTATSRARLVIDRRLPDTLVLQVDADGDGTFESSQNLTTEQLTPSGPKLVSATVVGPETIDGASPFGLELAVLFDRVVDATSAAVPSNYSMPNNSVQTAKRQLSGRFVFASMNEPEAAYVATTLAVSGIRDPRGTAGASQTVTLASRLEDPGAVVSGRVIGADGTPVTGGVVTYRNNSNWQCLEAMGNTDIGFAAVTLDAQGRYEFRYVRQDKCGHPWAMLVSDPTTGALHTATGFVQMPGERIVLDIALLGQGVVTGVVRDLTGAPVAGAQVVAISVTDPQVGGTAVSDGDGVYTVYGITVGQVNVRAAKSSGVGQSSGNIGRAGGTAQIDITLDAGAASAAGTVYMEDGASSAPVPGISVVFASNGTPVAVAQTDDAGAYAFTSLPAGPFLVSAQMNSRDGAKVSGTLVAGDARTNLDLVIHVPSPSGAPSSNGPGYGTVKGVVRLPDGTGAPDVIVTIAGRGVLSTEGGAFEIPGVLVMNGQPQTVQATSRDGLRSGSALASVNQAGQVVQGVSIVLSGLGSAAFTVLSPSGAALPGMQVGLLDRCDAACGCNPATSDANGKVQFDGLPLGSASARVLRSGANFIDVATASVSITHDGETANGVLRFAGSGVVSGTVRDPQGHPVYGADVALSAPVFNSDYCTLSGSIAQRVRSNSAGAFRFTAVNVGSLSVTASQTFYPNPVSKSGALTQDGQELSFDLVMNNGVSTISGELSGIVFLPDGTTPAGAGVEVTATGQLPDVIVNTDAQGKYHFAKIFPEGGYTLTARDPITGGVAQGSVYLRAAQDATQDMRLLGRGTVIVHVVDAADVPVDNAFVRLQETSFPGGTFEGAIDAAHLGVVTFDNVFEGALSAEASDVFARGGRASDVLSGPGATLDLKVRLSMTGRVTGIFVAPDGTTPIPFGALTLTASGRAIGQSTTQGSGTDVGRFAFDYVPAGPVRVDAQDPATARTGSATGTIGSQGQVVDLRIRAQGLGTVEGFVLSNGTPQAAADVDLVAPGFRASTTTDATGRYRITGVPEGQVTATATPGNGFLLGTASANLVGDGTTLELSVSLRASTSVSGRVVKSDGVTAAKPSLVAISVGGTGGGSLSTVSDADGHFSFDRVPTGTATITADVLGSIDQATMSAEVPTADGLPITIKLHGVGALHGTAFGPSSLPTSGTLSVTGTGDLPYGQTISLPSNGTFAFPELLAGPVTVSLSVPSGTFTLYGSATGTVVPDQSTNIDVHVQPTGTVVGRVLRSDKLTPAFGTEITLQLLPGGGRLVLYAQDDGRFSIPGVPLGSFSLGFLDSLSGGVALVQGRSLSTSGETANVGDVILDDTPVAVVSISPPNGAQQVPVSQPIQILFSDPLASTNGIQLSAGSSSINASATLSADKLTVTLQGTWPDAKDIFVTATTAVTDIYGRHPTAAVSSQFHTVDLSPPKVAHVSPADQAIEVAASTSIDVTFDEPLDASASVSSLVTLTSANGTVLGVTTRTAPDAVSFMPSAALPGDTRYNVKVNGARDLSGNVQTQAFSSSFSTHDSVAPQLSLTQPPPGSWTNNPRPPIVVSLADSLSGIDTAGVVAFALDATSAQPSISTSALSFTPGQPLGDGEHQVTAQVADRAGNTGSMSAQFQIDTVLPSAATLAGVVSGDVLVGTVAIAANASDAGSGVREIRVLADGDPLVTLSAPGFTGNVNTLSLSEGRHSLTARSLDLAGNLGPAGAAVDVVVNNAPIVVTITAPAAGTPVKNAVQVAATVSEPVKRVVFSAGSASVTDDTAPYEVHLDVTSLPAPGNGTITVTAIGLLDETASATRSIVIDRTPPAAPSASLIFAEPPDNGLSLVHGDPGAIEPGATTTATNVASGKQASIVAAADGTFAMAVPGAIGDTISLVATDAAGNVSAATTVVVRSTTTLPPVAGTLLFDGTPLDRVGPGVSALAPDGKPDAAFELSFAMGTGITRQLAYVDLQGPSARSTRLEIGAVLGVASNTDLSAAFLNHTDGSVDASLTANVSLLLFADTGSFLQGGATYTATAAFTNGSRFVGSVTLPAQFGGEVGSAAFSVQNQKLTLDPSPPATGGEVASVAFSVQNQKLALDPTPPATGGEIASATFSVQNQSLALDPTQPAAGGEIASATFSVQNQSLALDPNAPSATGEVASMTFSVNNQQLPSYAQNPQPVTEIASVTFSVNNQALAFDASTLPGSSEYASMTFSVNNDPTTPPTPPPNSTPTSISTLALSPSLAVANPGTLPVPSDTGAAATAGGVGGAGGVTTTGGGTTAVTCLDSSCTSGFVRTTAATTTAGPASAGLAPEDDAGVTNACTSQGAAGSCGAP
jgi:hypothetical protein